MTIVAIILANSKSTRKQVQLPKTKIIENSCMNCKIQQKISNVNLKLLVLKFIYHIYQQVAVRLQFPLYYSP